jgi:hypothetical protein
LANRSRQRIRCEAKVNVDLENTIKASCGRDLAGEDGDLIKMRGLGFRDSLDPVVELYGVKCVGLYYNLAIPDCFPRPLNCSWHFDARPIRVSKTVVS